MQIGPNTNTVLFTAACRRLALISVLLLAVMPAAGVLAQTEGSKRAAPAELSAFTGATAGWQLRGSGALRFFGFKAYDAFLWAQEAIPGPNPATGTSPFALEIEYNTSLKSEEIVNVSLVEMARLRRLTDAQVKAWTAAMQKTFPSVQAGDRLTGVQLPKVGTRFFLNGRLVSEINDPAFGDAFFAIWLDEGTKRPDLRRALLGLPAASPPATERR